MNIEQLTKLADLLDSKNEHDAANEVDKIIRSMAADPTEPEWEGTGGPQGPGWPGVEEGPEEEPDEESPEDFEAYEKEKIDIKWSLKNLAKIIREELIYFLETPNSEDHYKELLNLLSRYKDQWMREAYPVSSVSSVKQIFTKLSKVADDLDEVGAQKEADMIDAFLTKYGAEYGEFKPSEHGDPFSPEEMVMTKCPECANPREGEICEYCGDEGPTEMGEMPELKTEGPTEGLGELEGEEELPPEVEKIMKELKELEDKRAALISKLDKKADYNEDRKEEGDTERSKRYDSKHHHNQQIREPKRDQERPDREGRKEHHVYKPHEGSLSTRYCPNHIGSMMSRIGEATFQCPLDGEVFNWENGYTTFDGVSVPGGSIAGQTPNSTDYAIPNRVFDSRDKVLNVIN